jgi:hypothetical protein
MKKKSETSSEENDEFVADDRDTPNILSLVREYSEQHRKKLQKKDTPSFNRNFSDANQNNESSKFKEEEKMKPSSLEQVNIDAIESEDGAISEDDLHVERVTENNLKNTKKSLINLGTSFLRQDEAQIIEQRLKLGQENLMEGEGEDEDTNNMLAKSKTTKDFSNLKITNRNRDKQLDACYRKKTSHFHAE